MAKHYPVGLDDRMRDHNGEIREKRGDTLIGTLESEYKVDFGVRSDMRLDTYLKETGHDTLSQALRDL